MPQQIVIAEQLRIAAVLTDECVDELIVAQGRYQIGDVYLGTVENVLPGIDAAFVNIGESEKNGFIHVTDLGPLRLKKGAAGITELLEPRQKVLVQVMKEPTGTKGPRLTGNLALPGRYLVLQPSGQGVNISRRIGLEGERNRLRALGVLVKPPGAGLLIRTEADGISEELLIDDLNRFYVNGRRSKKLLRLLPPRFFSTAMRISSIAFFAITPVWIWTGWWWSHPLLWNGCVLSSEMREVTLLLKPILSLLSYSRTTKSMGPFVMLSNRGLISPPVAT